MRVRWLRSAGADLRRIARYIAQDNPTAAERLTVHMTEAVAALAEHPLMGRPGRVLSTRELVVSGTPYIVAYRVREGVVEILAVIYGPQQWPTSF